jgi:hypothetical protein
MFQISIYTLISPVVKIDLAQGYPDDWILTGGNHKLRPRMHVGNCFIHSIFGLSHMSASLPTVYYLNHHAFWVRNWDSLHSDELRIVS